MSMKNIKRLLGVFSMILGTVVFTACSDDEKQEAPVFPESVVLNCQPGESEPAELVFTANQPWTLASSKLWCKFSVDGELVNSLAGGVGEQTVKVVATDDVWDFNDALAELTLSMGGQTKAIAIVNRSANERDLKIYQDIEHPFGKENPAEFKYAIVGMSLKDVKIVANFDWEIQKYPEWVSIDEQYMVGKAGKITTVTFDFNEEADIRYPFTKEDTNNRIVFVNKDGKEYSVDIPVVYEGMPEDAVQFPIEPFTKWTFSQDARQYWIASDTPEGDGPEVVDKNFVELQVITPGKYHLVCFSYEQEYGYTLLDEWSTWIYTDINDICNVSVSVSRNSGMKREGYILAIPDVVYKTLNGEEDLLEHPYDDDYAEIKEKYNKYILMRLSQEGEKAGGFDIMTGDGAPVTDGLVEVPELGNDFGTTNAWKLTLPKPDKETMFIITPKGLTVGSVSNYLWKDVTLEQEGNTFYLGIPASVNIESEDMYIAIRDENWLTTGVLFISFY